MGFLDWSDRSIGVGGGDWGVGTGFKEAFQTPSRLESIMKYHQESRRALGLGNEKGQC